MFGHDWWPADQCATDGPESEWEKASRKSPRGFPRSSGALSQDVCCDAPSSEPALPGCAGVALAVCAASFLHPPCRHRRPDRGLGDHHRRLRHRRRDLGARWIFGRRILLLKLALAAYHRRFRFRRPKGAEIATRARPSKHRVRRDCVPPAGRDRGTFWRRRTSSGGET